MRPAGGIAAALIGLVLGASACSSGSNASSTSSSTATSKTPVTSGVSSGTTTLPDATASTYLELVAPVDRARIAFIDTKTHLGQEVTAGPFATALTTWQHNLESYSWPSAAVSSIAKLENDIPPLVTSLRNISTANWGAVNASTFSDQGSTVTADTNAARHALGLPPA